MMSVKIVDSESPYLRMESGVGAGGHSASSQEEQTVGLRKFQRSKSTILGAIEVAIGIFMTLTAIIYLAVDVDFVITAILFWEIIVYIPAGAMAIATDKKRTKAMVWGTLGMNVLAALSAVAGSVLHFYASVLFVYPPSSRGGQHLRNTELIMIVLSIVVFIVSIVVAAFAVAALCSSRKQTNEHTGK